MQAPESRTVVLHSTPCWLQRTKTWIYEQVRSLPPRIEVHVACLRVEHLDQFPLENLHVLDAAWRRRLEFLARHARLGAARFGTDVACRTRATVLHSHFGTDAFWDLAVARAAGLRQVVTFYGFDVTRVPRAELWRRRYAALFREVDRVLCEGPHMRRELVRLGCPEAKAEVQHLGVRLSEIEFRPRVYRSGAPLSVLIAGAFREKKGIPDAIRALGVLRRERPGVELEVTIVGDAGPKEADQLEKRRILEALRETGLGAHTKLVGFQPHAALMRAGYTAHVLLSPSVTAVDGDTEGGAPVTILEMAASGMPVVSTTHCDIPNVLTGPASALLAPEHDVLGLAARLCRLVDAPGDWQGIAEHVRRDLEQRFDAARQGELLARHYEALAALGPPRVRPPRISARLGRILAFRRGSPT